VTGDRRTRGAGSLYQNERGVWGIRFYDSQRRQRRELTGKTGDAGRLAAERLLRKRFGEIDNAKFDGDGRRLRLDDLEKLVVADHEMTGRPTKQVRASYGHLREFFGHGRAIDIPRQMGGYLRERLLADPANGKAAGKGTVRREVAALGRGFTLAVRGGLLATKPSLQNVAPAPARKGFATDEQIDAVVAALPEELRPLVRFLAETGWRSGEGTALRWAAVDFAAREVRIAAGESKTGEPRVFPMTPVLLSLLREQRVHTDRIEREHRAIVPFVFHRGGQPIRYFGDAWKSACKKVGLPALLVHDLRRSAARRMVRAGVPQIVAMKLMGHKTASIFERYAIVSEADLAAAVEKLARGQ